MATQEQTFLLPSSKREILVEEFTKMVEMCNNLIDKNKKLYEENIKLREENQELTKNIAFFLSNK
jgi:hypothetical protein